jgi:hypothetical protein
MGAQALPRFWTKGQESDREAIRCTAAAVVGAGAQRTTRWFSPNRKGRPMTGLSWIMW